MSKECLDREYTQNRIINVYTRSYTLSQLYGLTTTNFCDALCIFPFWSDVFEGCV